MNKNFMKVIFSELVRIGTAPFRVLPIKKNRILFTGLTGGRSYDYSCNPKYLYEYLRDHYPGQYEYVWAVKDKAQYSFLEEEGVKLVKHFTVSSFPMLLTSNIIVTNGSYAPWFPFRKKQYVINTWHGGGAYKKVENEAPGADWATKRRARFCADNIDLFLASCRVQEEQMIRTTYQYKGEVLRAGTPRNDKLVNGDTDQMANKVRQQYGIAADTHILLYAPTYRKANPPVEFLADELVHVLEETGEKWVVLSRFHRYQTQDMNLMVSGTKVIEAADYPDMQELLCAADIMVTDYSSCVWDYSFLKRPCVLYVPDQQQYIEHTGFYVPMEEWPFLRAHNMSELKDIMVSLRDNQERENLLKNMEAHIQALGGYENGACREQLAAIIKERVSV